MFLAKPGDVLTHFRAAGIGALSELDLYAQVCERYPYRQAAIEAEATAQGIPLR